jgi:ADP-ribosylglycohydrolase
MRAAPLGCWGARVPAADLEAWAHADTALSHPNATCRYASAAYVLAIRHLVLAPGDSDGALAAARSALQDAEAAEVCRWMDDALAGSAPACHPQAGFVRTGFTRAFMHLHRKTGFRAALADTLAGGGDTDTNACIVGGLLGALHGENDIPQPMIRGVLECDTALGQPRPDWLHPRQIDALLAGEFSSSG